MSDDTKRTLDEPHDRLTRIGDEMLEALKASKEFSEGIKAIVMLHYESRGGVAMYGYDENEQSDAEAIADIVVWLDGIMRANGKTLQVHTLRKG